MAFSLTANPFRQLGQQRPSTGDETHDSIDTIGRLFISDGKGTLVKCSEREPDASKDSFIVSVNAFCTHLTLTNDTPAFPPIFFPLVVHVHALFLRAISPLHLPSCYIPSTPLPVLALPCNPSKCHKFCLSLLFSPEEAKLAKRREKKKLPVRMIFLLALTLTIKDSSETSAAADYRSEHSYQCTFPICNEQVSYCVDQIACCIAS